MVHQDIHGLAAAIMAQMITPRPLFPTCTHTDYPGTFIITGLKGTCDDTKVAEFMSEQGIKYERVVVLENEPPCALEAIDALFIPEPPVGNFIIKCREMLDPVLPGPPSKTPWYRQFEKKKKGKKQRRKL